MVSRSLSFLLILASFNAEKDAMFFVLEGECEVRIDFTQQHLSETEMSQL